MAQRASWWTCTNCKKDNSMAESYCAFCRTDRFQRQQPVRYFIISFPLGKDSIEYFSYKVTDKDLRITLIKQGSLVYPNNHIYDISRNWTCDTKSPLLICHVLSEEQVKTMMKQPQNAYNRYDLTVIHGGGTVSNLTKQIATNYYHIIIEG